MAAVELDSLFQEYTSSWRLLNAAIATDGWETKAHVKHLIEACKQSTDAGLQALRAAYEEGSDTFAILTYSRCSLDVIFEIATNTNAESKAKVRKEAHLGDGVLEALIQSMEGVCQTGLPVGELRSSLERELQRYLARQEEAALDHLERLLSHVKLEELERFAPRLKRNRAVALKILNLSLRKDGMVLLSDWISPELGDDRSFVLEAAVQGTGEFLCFAGAALQDDFDVVEAATKGSRQGCAFAFASEAIRGSKEKVLLLLLLLRGKSCDYGVLQFASPELQADIDVAKQALKSCPGYLRHVAPSFRKDREFLLAISDPKNRFQVKQEKMAIVVLTSCLEPLRSDGAFILEMLRRVEASQGGKCPKAVFRGLEKKLRDHRDFALQAVRLNHRYFADLSAVLKADVNIAVSAVKRSADAWPWVPGKIHGLVRAKVKQDVQGAFNWYRTLQNMPSTPSTPSTPSSSMEGSGSFSNNEVEAIRLISCGICFEPLLHGAKQCPSGHLLCSDCLKELFERPAKARKTTSGSSSSAVVPCPTCREAFPLASYGRNLVVEQMAQGAVVHCPLGCGEQLRLDAVRKHAEHACQLRKVACPLGCELHAPVAEVIEHLHLEHRGLMLVQFQASQEGGGPLRHSLTVPVASVLVASVTAPSPRNPSLLVALGASHVLVLWQPKLLQQPLRPLCEDVVGTTAGEGRTCPTVTTFAEVEIQLWPREGTLTESYSLEVTLSPRVSPRGETSSSSSSSRGCSSTTCRMSLKRSADATAMTFPINSDVDIASLEFSIEISRVSCCEC